MVVRLKEWIIPYTAWDWIDISDNHVISVLLREANNLIHINEDREMYVDLQLDDGIEPTDDFPVWVTTWRILAEDWWPQNWIILNWKTTSWDYNRLIYAADWKLYHDPGTWVWNELWWSWGSCDCNVKLFSLSWASDLTTAQAILDWQKAWKDAIIAYDNEIYMFKTYRVVTQTPAVWLSYNKIVRDWVSQGYTETVAKAIEINYDSANNNTVSSIFLDEYKVTNASIDPTSQYNSAFMPTQPYHPASKAYVDQMVSWVYIYKWSVNTYSDLANIQNPEVWDVYNVVDSGMNYAWTGTDWDALWGTINYTAWDWIWINNWVISNTKPGATVSSTAPSNPSEWDLWYDTTNDLLKSYDGTQWHTIWSWGWGWSYSGGRNIDITNDVINLKLIEVNISTPRETMDKVGTTTAWNYSPTKWDLLLVNFVNWTTATRMTLDIDGSWAIDVRVRPGSTEITTTLHMTGNNQKVIMYFDGTYYRTWSLHNNYAVMTDLEMQAGSSWSPRNISPALLKSAVKYWWPKTATSTTEWLVKLWSDTVQNESAQSPSSTSWRTYPVQLNSNWQAVVNVPWSSWGGWWWWSYTAGDGINIDSNDVISNTMYPTNQSTGNVWDILTKSASWTVWLDSSLLYNVKAWNVTSATSSTLESIVNRVNTWTSYSAILKLDAQPDVFVYGKSVTVWSTTTYYFPSVENSKNADTTTWPSTWYTTVYNAAYTITYDWTTYTWAYVPQWQALANVIEPTWVPYTWYFTPTADYHPATKKYVDDAISQAWWWNVSSTTINNIWTGTQVEYDAIATKSTTTLYFVIES